MALKYVTSTKCTKYDHEHANDLPLKNQEYYIEVNGRNARLTITQEYQNNLDTRIEAFYQFPLPAEATIFSFEAIKDDGKVIKGVCKEKYQSLEEYNNAIKNGNIAYYMEYYNNKFNIAIGGMTAKSNVIIKFNLTCELENENDYNEVRVIIPLTIEKNYHYSYLDMENAQDSIDIQKCSKKPYNMKISGDINMIGKIISAEYHGKTEVTINQSNGAPSITESIKSKTHEVILSNVTKTSAHFEIVDLQELTEDVVLIIKRELSESSSFCQTIPHSIQLKNQNFRHCTSINIVPNFSNCVKPNMNNAHYVLVLDVSRSMNRYMESGAYESDHPNDMTRLMVCKRAAKQFVGLIPNGATFELILFNDRYEVCDLGGTELTMMQKKQKASKWINKIKATAGTHLYPALKYVYSNTTPTKNTVIILITDGSINDNKEVFRLIQKNPLITIFSLGIGNSVSQYLIQGVAFRSGGQSAYIGSGETDRKTVQKKVQEFLDHAKTSLRRHMGNYDLIFNCESEPIFVPEPGRPLYEKVDNTFYVFTETPVKSIEFSTIEILNGIEVTKTRTIIPKELMDCEFLLHKIGGGKFIKTLETMIKPESKKKKLIIQNSILEESLNVTQSSKIDNSADVDEMSIIEFNTNLKNYITTVSIDLGILAQTTAFIAVEQNLNPDTSEMIFREIPLQSPDNVFESKYLESAKIIAECVSNESFDEVDRDPYRVYPEDDENNENEENENRGESQIDITIVPKFIVEIDLGGVDLGEFVTSEKNVSLRNLIDFDFQKEQILQLQNQNNAKLNGFYEIVNLGSNDEPWLLEHIS